MKETSVNQSKVPDQKEDQLGETPVLTTTERKKGRLRKKLFMGRTVPDGASSPAELKEKSRTTEAIILSAVARHNEKEEHSLLQVPIDEKTEFDLILLKDGINNQLVIHAENIDKKKIRRENIIHISHYDPAQQKFLVYPELISQDDFAVIEPIALQRREDNKAVLITLDYDIDEIRDLHKKHREVLLEDGLVYKLAERCNGFSSEKEINRIPKYIIDESTSFYLCFVPKLGGYASLDPQADNVFKTDEVFVSLALQGHLLRNKNGVMQRDALHYIHLGAGYIGDPNGIYIPNRKLVTDEEFAKITVLTSELQELKATTLPKLDTEMVALKLGEH